jgi:hypothetical protein
MGPADHLLVSPRLLDQFSSSGMLASIYIKEKDRTVTHT